MFGKLFALLLSRFENNYSGTKKNRGLKKEKV